MLIIGITGPSGAGKGAVSDCIKKYGFKVIDADEVYHGIIAKPSDCVSELAENFGSEIINSEGGIDRAALASLVFGNENKEKLLLLNRITHKYVDIEIRRLLETYSFEGHKLCAIDAPLLIEAGIDEICDRVLAVLADKEIRAKRISARDGIDYESAMRRIDSQKPDSFYSERSDYVIKNDGGIEEIEECVYKILNQWSILK